jgi:hypothetical protein
MAKFSLTLFVLLFVSPAWLFATPTDLPVPCAGVNPDGINIGQTHLKCELVDGNIHKWTITQPDVTKPLTEYPNIVFHADDRVLVSAEGCVNVGTKTPDWRRYVDPEGSRTDRFFHGLIWIPGARIYDKSEFLVTPVGTAPIRISSIAGGQNDPSKSELLIVKDPTEGNTTSTFRLGYEIDYGRPWWLVKNGHQPRPLPWLESASQPGSKSENLRSIAYSGVPSGRQCDGQGTATVIVRITPGSSTQPPEASPTRSLLPFDPVSNQTDENGFMLAPRFYGNYDGPDTKQLEATSECKNFEYKHWLFVRYGIKSPCTQQASFDVPPHILTECLAAPGFGQLHGHVNWAPATFVGKLRPKGDLKGNSADRDFDLQLFTLDDLDRRTRFADSSKDFGKVGPILTSDSQPIADYKDALWLEFASYETYNVTHPNDTPKPAGYDKWKNLLEKATRKMVTEHTTDHTAVVTGLLNLDCVHDCHTELHPVFAMAVRTTREDKDSGVVNDDPWAIFVRNAGNEGDCAADEHYLNRDSYTFFLPAPVGAVPGKIPTVNNLEPPFWAKVDGLTKADDKTKVNRTTKVDGITWKLQAPPAGSSGVYVTFSFANAKNGACKHLYSLERILISGVLHLNWGKDPDSPRVAAAPPDPGLSPVTRIDDTDEQKTTCTTAMIGDIYPTEITDNEKESAKLHDRNPPQTFSHLPELLNDIAGRDVGVFPDILLYNKTGQVQINPGFRAAVIQTSLGSFEVDASPGLSRSVRSTNGTNISVRISDFLYGFKIRFPTELNIFAEAKGGMLWRSAGAGYTATPDFERFHGRDALFLIGGGIEPGKQTLSRGIKVFVRVSADYMYLPGTGEHMVRITVGPQFRFPRK